MAKMTLPTNYVDDVMNSSVGGKRKYRMIYNEDNTVSFEDVTPYDQVGSNYGAGDINATNQAVNESVDKNKVISDVDAINALTEEGYIPDALVVKNFTSVYLTQAEYDALPDSKESNDVEYRIIDASIEESVASNISYDNTLSGLDANSVQSAVDELIDSLQWKLLGSATGKTAINLPSVFNELYVELSNTNSTAVNFAYVIPYNTLTDETKGYRQGGYASAQSFLLAVLNVSKTSCIINSVQDTNGDNSSKYKITVYYR